MVLLGLYTCARPSSCPPYDFRDPTAVNKSFEL